jgi:cytochrome P450 family 138
MGTGRYPSAAMAQTRMPPGPPLPRVINGLLALTAQNQALVTMQRRYGDVFTVPLPVIGRSVIVADPELGRQVFRADAKVLHAGSQSPLRAVLGPHSLLAIDEDYHLSQRKLLLPPFHGERMKGYEAIFEEEATREFETWPADRPFATLPSFMRITLNAIIRAVFGAQQSDADELRRLLPAIVARGSQMAMVPFLHHDVGAWSPWGKFVRLRAEFDAVVDRLIAQARVDDGLEERSDVLALLVQATHEDGSSMHRDEIADELLTLLAAGHETTAATLAWAVERLRRHPPIVARLAAEIAEGGSELREATVKELQRVRPTITGVGRQTQEPYELGEWLLPTGTVIMLSARLIHYDARWYDEPERFDPDRFVGRKPDTYRWIPFGGGMRRCVGAAFAHMEMDVVLRTLLSRFELAASRERDEGWRFRGVAFAPGRGGVAVVRPRSAPLAPAPAEAVAAA